MPPIRYLCEHLHLSKNTVESAYQQLTAEGYTESRPRIGIKVLPLEKTLMPPSQLKIHTNREQKDTGQASAATYDFKYGDIDLSHFPFKTWRRCLQNAMDSGDHDLFCMAIIKAISAFARNWRSIYFRQGVCAVYRSKL